MITGGGRRVLPSAESGSAFERLQELAKPTNPQGRPLILWYLTNKSLPSRLHRLSGALVR